MPQPVHEHRVGERMVRIDDVRQLRVGPPVRRGRAGDRDMVADPPAAIPDEHQVRQRLDDEVRPGQQLVHDAAAAAELGRRQARDQHLGERFGAVRGPAR
jgi:hypothetical protein